MDLQLMSWLGIFVFFIYSAKIMTSSDIHQYAISSAAATATPATTTLATTTTTPAAATTTLATTTPAVTTTTTPAATTTTATITTILQNIVVCITNIIIKQIWQTHSTSPAAATTTAAVTTTATPATTPATTAATTTLQGAVIIVGGYDGGGRLSDVESFNTPALPDLPTAAGGLTLSLVGTAVYACGGEGHSQSCHRLDTSNKPPHWTLLANKIPVQLSYHTESVIGTHIWLVHDNTLFDLNTDTEEFNSHTLQFKVDQFLCAVSNNTHSYIIGAGEDKNEIWLNSEASSPENWHKVANMSTGRTYHACLWVDNKVYFTGGWRAAYRARDDVEVLDTATNTVASIGPLGGGRRAHEMMLHDGKPAVIGGRDDGGDVLASIATYDAAADKWETSTNTMKPARSLFGLAQFGTI